MQKAVKGGEKRTKKVTTMNEKGDVLVTKISGKSAKALLEMWNNSDLAYYIKDTSKDGKSTAEVWAVY